MRTQFATLQRRRQRARQRALNALVVTCALLVPVFPATGLYAQKFTGVVVRGDYDESTIITATTPEALMEQLLDGEVTLEGPEEAPTSPDTLPPEIVTPTPEEAPKPAEDPKKTLFPTHIVTPRQTLAEISKKYTISIDELKKANPGLTEDLKIDQKILIPKIQGIEYVVKKGDTLSTIAEVYGVKSLYSILLANDMSDAAKIRIGQKILLPNPTKNLAPAPKPATPAAKKPSAAQKDSSPAKITYGSYSLDLKVSKGCRNFAWGNCTCFVAKYKNVTWRGNAKQWLANAKKAGAATGKNPEPGAIIVYDGPGFPPAYGHVGIVMEVNDDHMIIKDMNYRGLNEITTRKEKFTNPAIKGYIYVD